MKKILSFVLLLLLLGTGIPSLSLHAVNIPDYFPNTYVNTGNQLEDIIGVALSQNGYYDFDRKGNQYYGQLNGYSKYSEWFVNNSYGWAWCASFISWCANQAGISSDTVVYSYRAHTMLTRYKEQGVFHRDDPKRGDIMFFRRENDPTVCGHVAIVTDVFEDGIYTIQGNHEYRENEWMCAKVFYAKDDPVIMGYASPRYSGTDIDVYNTESPFRDVFRNAWYRDAVEYCYSENIINGVSRFELKPDDALTRAMFVQILMNLSGNGEKSETENIFKDVPTDQWFAPAVCWGYENGIVTGVSEELFKPHKSITRQEMITMLYRYHKYNSENEYYPDYGVFYEFTDYLEIAGWACEPMAWAVSFGVIEGDAAKRIMPFGIATRAQSIQIIYNFSRG
ncbi:MAG: S-layer homology domain-containing protein [Clostridia bacterium]|nr:S-layer homology domain-containing protein [Clostridia bacterium]